MLIVLLVVLIILIFIFTFSYFCFSGCFYNPERKKIKDTFFYLKDIAPEKYYPTVNGFMKIINETKYTRFEIKSYDNLKLIGNYYEFKKGAPIFIFFHGYKSSLYSDCNGAFYFSKEFGCNVLAVNQRSHGFSEGKVITFGIKEKYDVKSWVEFVIKKFGKDIKIVLSGVSMGASTVMLSTVLNLPKNVKAIVSDCGYTSCEEVIKLTIKKMKLPPELIYPFMKLGAVIYGGFSLNSITPIEALKSNKIPIIFMHGEKDTIVPCEMGKREYEENCGKKKIVLFKDATHGISYLEEPIRYRKEIYEFLAPLIFEK